MPIQPPKLTSDELLKLDIPATKKDAQRMAERLSLALEGASDGLWDWDLVTNEVYLSPRWKGILGYGDDELPGSFETFESLVHPDDREKANGAIQDYLAGKTDLYQVELRMLHKDGEDRTILSRGAAIRNGPEGEYVRFVGTHVDLTEIKRLEASLVRSRARLQGFVDVTADLVTQVDAQGMILFVNRAAEEVFGLSPEECVERPAFEFIHPDDRKATMASFGGWIRDRISHATFENRQLSVDGRVTDMFWSINPRYDENGELVDVWSIARDIGEKKRVEALLKEQAEDLRQSNEELRQFAYVASHDLQEPLRMVASYIQLLAGRYGDQLEDEAKEFMAYVVEGAGRMQALINDLLDYSQITTGGRRLERANAQAALENALRNLEGRISEAKAVITHDSLPTVLADETQLARVFQNLIGNAIKFRGEADPHVHVGVERCGEEWTFSVTDNGIGIEPEYQDRIFDIFQRLHARSRYDGTGIGLAICRRVVQRHGGRIWYESTVGEGTTFYFTLKAAD